MEAIEVETTKVLQLAAMSDISGSPKADGDREAVITTRSRSASPALKDRSASPVARSRSLSKGRSRELSKSRSPVASRSPVVRGRDRSISRSLSRGRDRRRRSPTPPPRRNRSLSPRRSFSPRRRHRSRSRDRYGGGYDRRRSPPYRGGDYGRGDYGRGDYGRGDYGRRRSPPPMRRRRTPPTRGLHLFVAGLNFQTSDREMREKFEDYGDVTEARIVRNPGNGESRGFGFVEMKTEDGCDEAIRALDGVEWRSRRLLVERARNVR